MGSDSLSTELWVIRHGETVWNSQNRIQGHLHGELNLLGRRQADAVAERLAHESFDALYSSDLERAYRTAECINKKVRLGIESDDRLRERNLGIFQGMTPEQVAGQYPAENERFKSGDVDYVIPEGESKRQRHERVIAAADEIAGRHAGKRVIIVTHGGPLCDMLMHTMHVPLTEPRRFTIVNAAVNVFEVTAGNWRLMTWGDVSHLGGLEMMDGNGAA